MKMTLLNTSILTNYGLFEYSPLEVEEARRLVKENEIQSAVGHKSTAAILSELLGIEVAVNRTEYSQEPGETALVFKLKGRAPEGQILSSEEIEKIGYEFGLLRRIK
jgi:hypothetical protein